MKQKTHLKLHSESIFEELEARQLFSGGIEGLILENDQTDDQAIYLDINAADGQTAQSSDEQVISTEATDGLRQELVFIDTDVENYQELLNDILAQDGEERNIEVIVLDNERDGIEQISEALASYKINLPSENTI